jgi:hypothetical protein
LPGHDLAAGAENLRQVRGRAGRGDDVLAVDMPHPARETRAYGDYLPSRAALAGSEIEYAAVSLVGPRKPIDRIGGGMTMRL